VCIFFSYSSQCTSPSAAIDGKAGKALGIITMSLGLNIVHISDEFDNP
jgi:hypothetical protein